MRGLAFGFAVFACGACVGEVGQLVGQPEEPAPRPVSPGPARPTPSPTDRIPQGLTAYLPTLSGHRISARGGVVAVADPEGPQSDGRAPAVHFVKAGLVRSHTFPDGSLPLAVELSEAGDLAWVLLEGSSGVAELRTADATFIRFHPVCRAPADLAVDGASVWVACREGEAVEIGGAARRVSLGGVPTTIAARNGTVYVGLSDATVLSIVEGQVRESTRPVPLFSTGGRFSTPNTPRRLLTRPNGELVLLHQRSVEGELAKGFGSGLVDAGTSAYSGLGCEGPATQGVVSVGTPHTGLQEPVNGLNATLPLDEAVSPVNGDVVVVDAATHRLLMMGSDTLMGPNLPCERTSTPGMPVEGVVGATFTESGQLVALTAKDRLSVVTLDANAVVTATQLIRSRTVSAGFELFHQSPGDALTANVACASCHPAGLNNGATLTINGVKHKVMSLGGHSAGLHNVHWASESFDQAVIEGTWKRNMRGRALSALEASSLRDFVAQLGVPPAPWGDAQVVARGRASFDRAGCNNCHDASRQYTNNSVADVGRGTHRVPSLVGLAYSAPYMNDGCATTLELRFTNPACGGGERHGQVAQLSSAELHDLIAFLKTL